MAAFLYPEELQVKRKVKTVFCLIAVLLPFGTYAARRKVDGVWYDYSNPKCNQQNKGNSATSSNVPSDTGNSRSNPRTPGSAVTVGGHVACLKEEWLDDVVKFVSAGDTGSFKAYIEMQKCVVLKPGLEVTVIEYPGMFGTRTQFAFRGIKFWTVREALKY